jgi:hypothetical protein
MQPKHIVLIGDSIFDNGGYVGGGDSVIEQLNRKLPEKTKSTLLAVDGDVTEDVYAQLENIPNDATHVFISCGGNDALRIISILNKPVESVGHAMDVFTDVKNQFEERYSRMVLAVSKKVGKVTICTVHDSVPEYTTRALTALSMFNEVILKEAFRINAPVIDLRLACNEAQDYSPVSPIEPSVHGAKKISDLIVRVTQEHSFSVNKSSVYR